MNDLQRAIALPASPYFRHPHYRSFARRERAELWQTTLIESRRCDDIWIEDRLRASVSFQTVAEEALEAGHIPAVLEINRERGVLYVHSAITGMTELRICGLRMNIPEGPIDIGLNAGHDGHGYYVTYGRTNEAGEEEPQPTGARLEGGERTS